MNVKELILSHPAVDIAAALVDRLDIEPGKSSMTPSARQRSWTSSRRRNGRNTFFSAEEVFAGLGIPEPSEEERQEAHRQMCREMLINSLRTYRMLEKYMKKQ